MKEKTFHKTHALLTRTLFKIELGVILPSPAFCGTLLLHVSERKWNVLKICALKEEFSPTNSRANSSSHFNARLFRKNRYFDVNTRGVANGVIKIDFTLDF